jgi:hypothetical protein
LEFNMEKAESVAVEMLERKQLPPSLLQLTEM